MEKYAPNKMELASRDVVSRAEQTEINEGRGFPDGTVALDITVVPRKRIHEALREIVLVGRDFAGVDITREPIHIKPGNHYTMGGVKTDVHGATEIPGLYAAGEVRLRLGPRRQPPRRQLAARHADLRPPLRRPRRRPRQARSSRRALEGGARRRASARSPRSSAASGAPGGGSRRSARSSGRRWTATSRSSATRRGSSTALEIVKRLQGGGQDRLHRRPRHGLQPGRARGARARLHARLRRVRLRRRAAPDREPRRPVPHRLPGAKRRGVAQAHRPDA